MLIPRRGSLVQARVDPRDLRDPAAALDVVEGHDLRVGPVEVIRDVGHLLEEPLRGVADYPPEPLISTSKLPSQWGHVTASRLWPFSLIVRYRSSRYARSAAKSPSITLGLTSGPSPRRGTPREPRTTAR